MQDLQNLFTPDVMIFMIVGNVFSNALMVCVVAFLFWLLKPSIGDFLKSLIQSIQDAIKLLQDFKHSIDELKEVVHEMSGSIDSLNTRMKNLEASVGSREGAIR